MGKISASSSTTRIHPGQTGKPLAALSVEKTRTRRTIRFVSQAPSIYPTVTPATVPANGISDNPNAAETPIVAKFSG